jgi:hypothetical protein
LIVIVVWIENDAKIYILENLKLYDHLKYFLWHILIAIMTNSILKDIKRIIGMEDQLNSFGE